MTRVKIILREYQQLQMWEPLTDYEKRINDFVETHDVVEIAPIGMDGVMVRYRQDELTPEERKVVEHGYKQATGIGYSDI